MSSAPLLAASLPLPPLPLLLALTAVALSTLLWLAAPRRRGAGVPGPPEWPLIGALPWLLRHRAALLPELAARSLAYGGRTWSVAWLGSPRYFFITSPALVAHVLRDAFTKYEKGAFVAGKLGQLLGTGIFVTDGDAWEEQRKRAALMFSERSFHEHIFEDSLSAPLAALDAALAAAAARGAPFDLHALFHRFTLDAIGAVAFGDDIGALADAGTSPPPPFAAAFDGVQARVEARFFDPLWQLTEQVTGSAAAVVAGVTTLDAYCASLIERRRAAGDAATCRDLLSRAIAAGGAGASDAALRDLVLNFVIAGRDTTAQALSWTVACLAGGGAPGGAAVAAPPAVSAALADEARRVLGTEALRRGGGVVGGAVAYATIKGLRYATAVMKETLRLFPSVPKDVKMAVVDDVLPDGTAVRAGDVVAYLPFAMGRLESNWPRPLEFDPTRFLGETQPSPFLHIAFNAGRRTCLGQTLALSEGAAVLALLYRNYEVRRAGSTGALM